MSLALILAGWTAVTEMVEPSPPRQGAWPESCWNTGSLSVSALQTAVKLTLSFGQDGRPESGSIRMLAWEGHSEAAARQTYEAARRAIIRCGGDPVGTAGQTITMVFDPRVMRVEQVTP